MPCTGGADVDIVRRHGAFIGKHVLEQEGAGAHLVGQTACQLEGRMQVAVDQAGGGDTIAGVEGVLACPRFLYVGRFADGGEFATLDGDGGIANDAALCIDGDEPVDAVDDQVCFCHDMRSGAYYFHDSTFPGIIRHPLKAEIRTSLRQDNKNKSVQAN